LSKNTSESLAIDLFAELDSSLSELKSMLPEFLRQKEGVDIQAQLGGFWDLVDASLDARNLNLRRGAFARQLPIKRWWQSWRAPIVYMSVAFIAALAVFVGQYFSYKAQEKAVLSDIQTVYKKAVPNGRPGDPEGVLNSMLRGVAGESTQPSNFMFLLSKVTQALSQQKDTKLSSYSYNGDKMNLQLTLEFASLSDVGEFRSQLEKLGIKADSPRTNSTGGGYQARMRVEEAVQ
jgi:general secretion pathway protein L